MHRSCFTDYSFPVNGNAGSRLAHVLGLRGPTLTLDTACCGLNERLLNRLMVWHGQGSSSLVAIGVAHNALRKAMPEQVDPGILPQVGDLGEKTK